MLGAHQSGDGCILDENGSYFVESLQRGWLRIPCKDADLREIGLWCLFDRREQLSKRE
jgi:hypothetical protein